MKKGILRNVTKFTGKHLCQGPFFNKFAGLRPATLFKRKLLHSCFPGNFAKFSRTPFLQNTSGQLLLCFMEFSDWESYRRTSKRVALGKSAAVSMIVYQNILSNFREPQVEQPKQLLNLKKLLTVKLSCCQFNLGSSQQTFVLMNTS